MSLHRKVILAAAMAASLASSAWAYDFGRLATPDEIKLWDIDVRPDGTGLPQGSGTVAHGKQVYQDNCEVCHGANGEVSIGGAPPNTRAARWLNCALGGFTQQRFELGENLLDRIEIGTVGRQEE